MGFALIAALFAQSIFASNFNSQRVLLKGVANSSFQVEGSPQPSDWYVWTHTKGKIKDGTNADRATDFWNRYEEDISLAKDLGSNAFRISIAWERVEPVEGQFNQDAIDHYKKIVLAMRAKGIEPVVTLHHFVLPLWLSNEGGLLNAYFPQKFARFAKRMGAALTKAPYSVKYWITLNEPMVQAIIGYQMGVWPPGIQDGRKTAEAALSLAKAHIYGVRALRSLGKENLKISIAHHWRVFQPAHSINPVEVFYANVANDRSNVEFINSIMSGNLSFGVMGLTLDRVEAKIPLRKNEKMLDFLGINYYGRFLMQFKWGTPPFEALEGPGVKTDMGWEIYPKGMDITLEEVFRQFHLPILITENGLADRADSKRCGFIHDHFREMKRAISRGVPVLGYLHWSLTDNFEWAEGLTPRFGIVSIDYKTMERKPRGSFSCLEDEFSRWR